MSRPPRRPRAEPVGEEGVGLWDGSAGSLSLSQFAAGRGDVEGDGDELGFGSMHPRVLPPTRFQGRPPVDLLNSTSFDLEEGCNGGTQSGYFTDLLVNDVQESQIPSYTNAQTNIDTNATAKSSQGRSKNFSNQEDILLVSAWLNVGMDPIQGTDQSQGTYWARIHDYYHVYKDFETTRSEVSLMNRWSIIQHDVNVFCGCVSRIEARNQSGSRTDDKMANALALFKAEDKKQKKFCFMHCWNILKDKPKWMERRKEIDCAKKTSNKKQKTAANSSPAAVNPAASDAGGSEARGLGRPEGKKKEKQKLRQGRSIEAVDYLIAKKKEADQEKEMQREERCKKAFALQEERIMLEREKIEIEREKEDDRIMCLDMSTMTSEQQQYFEDRKNKILARHFNI
ncbi:hypothetical protein ACP4OV_009895 [Aristida adscensionis]